jgi:hypothetical protein
MSESELLEHFGQIFDRFWTIGQWWVGVSLALIVAGHFAGHLLSKLQLIIVLTAYSAYALMMTSFSIANYQLSDGIFKELLLLSETDGVSLGGQRLIESSPALMFGVFMFIASALILYLGSNAYLISSYRKARRKNP